MKQVFLNYQNIEINLLTFVTNLLIAFLLSHILSLVYVKYSNSLSNKKIFSNNFYLITLTTTLIITVVKSSLALSLGLVGALSIVRFRAAIKEPEEIAYLFLCIAIGLGMGANYTLVTVVGFGIILALVIILNRYTRKNIDQEEMFCTISLNKKINLEELLNMLKKHSNYLFLRDFDITDRFSQIGVIVNFKSSKEINSLSKELNRKYSGVNIKYLNKRALS
jgi:uncharacterized membrane protein YhiD involved in acid resistance